MALERSGAKLAGAVELHVTYDEEAGGEIGPRWLIEQGLTKPDLAIAAGFSYSVVNAHNGCLHLEVEIRGRSAHAAKPFTGVDALEAANGVLTALYAWRRGLSARVSAIPGIGSAQMTVGLISGGINTNVVPDRVVFRLDRRMIPEEKPAEVEAELRRVVAEAAKAFPAATVAVRRILLAEPLTPTPAGEKLTADARPPGEPRHGRTDRRRRRAALYRRAPLREGRRSDRAVRRRAAFDRGRQRPSRRRTPAARRSLQARRRSSRRRWPNCSAAEPPAPANVRGRLWFHNIHYANQGCGQPEFRAASTVTRLDGLPCAPDSAAARRMANAAPWRPAAVCDVHVCGRRLIHCNRAAYAHRMFVAPDRRAEASRYPAVLWRRGNAMRHFVRFAKVSASGSVDRGGWRLRIFLTSREAGAFAEGLAGKPWRVETGQYEDGEVAAAGRAGAALSRRGFARRRPRPARLIAPAFA